ncbi:hypothetical protein CAPTEDRAFT_227850 [Capitella teleta]|uniref:Fe2OG dioxygenase domain-containing protein n=1 Tax=Capitella teleta TaxID=283909 RepID=R7U793_CAPTE|nr:hypothetical protein CAPTEDRAFT_227850 [Capitella teleta]|eukprot:ELU02240.1 hypothetical protein CAPTEDRAFT_227850 [Capitella teleta]
MWLAGVWILLEALKMCSSGKCYEQGHYALTSFHTNKEQFIKYIDSDSRASLPSESAFFASCLTLIHLQRINNISMEDFAQGLMPNHVEVEPCGQISDVMNADDFYLVGSVAFRFDFYDESVTWLQKAEDLKMKETQNDTAENFDKFVQLCLNPTRATHQDLFCLNKQMRNSYGLWKTELLHANPEIYLFHDFISDSEIQRLKDMAEPQFQSSAVLDDTGGESFFDVSRLSSTAFVNDSNDLVASLNRRVSKLTGLQTEVLDSFSESESLQVLRYGPGGLYTPHYDTLGSEADLPPYIQHTGDRIATFILYLDIATAGGATVFPLLPMSIPIQKGAAAFWFNLHPDGSLDRRTLHAACPVIRGTKWECVIVSNDMTSDHEMFTVGKRRTEIVRLIICILLTDGDLCGVSPIALHSSRDLACNHCRVISISGIPEASSDLDAKDPYQFLMPLVVATKWIREHAQWRSRPCEKHPTKS